MEAFLSLPIKMLTLPPPPPGFKLIEKQLRSALSEGSPGNCSKLKIANINSIFDMEREGLAELKLLCFSLFLGMSCSAWSPKIMSFHQKTFHLSIKPEVCVAA